EGAARHWARRPARSPPDKPRSAARNRVRNRPPARRWSARSPPASAAEPAYRGVRCARCGGLPRQVDRSCRQCTLSPRVLNHGRAAGERGAILGGRLPLASCAPPRHMCACAPAIPDMSKAAEPAIAVDQLVKVYRTTRAVDGISFALERGSITGLLGGNGAGKTTTIAMIMGLVTPTSGTVKVL